MIQQISDKEEIDILDISKRPPLEKIQEIVEYVRRKERGHATSDFTSFQEVQI
jgi:small ligand-binding sensory domain FIST